jgi:hypothetical protein
MGVALVALLLLGLEFFVGGVCWCLWVYTLSLAAWWTVGTRHEELPFGVQSLPFTYLSDVVGGSRSMIEGRPSPTVDAPCSKVMAEQGASTVS